VDHLLCVMFIGWDSGRRGEVCTSRGGSCELGDQCLQSWWAFSTTS